MTPWHLFGIRHHGPGSARSLRAALEALRPDLVLIEGPPEADALLSLCSHADMTPPVAALIYAPDDPARAVYYPFAEFSPEWQAILYANQNKVPVRFMDLPPAHRLALEQAEQAAVTAPGDDTAATLPEERLHHDPLSYLASAAGYNDSERWWEHMVEERRDSGALFLAIREAMTALRQELGSDPRDPARERIEVLREAHMRKTLRAAVKQGHARIAVVCGAWHVPALEQMPSEKHDNDLLKGLPSIKTRATWVPWTYGRLSFASGYGAGVEAPGWYHHLWTSSAPVAVRWLTGVARALRDAGIDVSSAHVIEAVRLAEALAALRARPQPGLPELNEAIQSVMLFGEAAPMALVRERLIIGERLGAVPAATPMTPLQQDLAGEQKRLRLKPAASDEELMLDLRKPMDRERSQLFRRLEFLGVAWARGGQRAGGKGTFKEGWRTQWQPEFEIRLIEAGRYGNSIAAAAGAAAMQQATDATELPVLAGLARTVIFADLPQALEFVMQRLQAEAALASDTAHLMQALPPLAQLERYGDVRDTDTALVAAVVDGLVTRICVGLPHACAGLGEDAAEAMFEQVREVHAALRLLERPDYLDSWLATLVGMLDQHDLHGILQGHCCRLLLDAGRLDDSEAARRFGLALSTANDPIQAAAWVDGFLRGSGQLLVHDETLWSLIDNWVSALTGVAYAALLPLLRRTFATFTPPERRQIGERVQRGPGVAPRAAPGVSHDVDRARAECVLPVLEKLLGLKTA